MKDTKQIFKVFAKFLEIKSIRGMVLITLSTIMKGKELKKCYKYLYLTNLIEWVKDDDALISATSLQVLRQIIPKMSIGPAKTKSQLFFSLSEMDFEKLSKMTLLLESDYKELKNSPLNDN